METATLKQAFEQLRSDRSNVEAIWDEIDRYITPFGDGQKVFGGTEGEVEWRRPELWDFTAIDGCDKLQATLHGTLTTGRWFKLAYKVQELRDDPEAGKYLEACTEAVYDGLQASDFDAEISPAYGNLVSKGPAMLAVEPLDPESADWKGLDFTCVALREGYPQLDSHGNVVRFFRHLRWTAVQQVEKFGRDGVPEKIRSAYDNAKDVTQKYDVIFCIYQRPERLGQPVEQVMAPELRPYGYRYFLLDTGENLGKPGQPEGGYYEMPVFLAVWKRAAGSMWGYGQGTIALPTVRYLNCLLDVDLAAREKVVDPAHLVTERGLLSDVDLQAGGTTAVRTLDDIKVFESGAKFDLSGQSETELRAQIRQLFFVDQLALKDSPQMTAYEAAIRYEIMNRLMGSSLARIKVGILSRTIETSLRYLSRATRGGKPVLPAMPDQVKRAGGEAIIEYQGPLARAERTDEVAAIERLAAGVAALAKLFPDAAEEFNPRGAVRALAQRLGTPADCLRSPAEVDRKIRERQALQERMAKAEAARAEGEAVEQGAAAAGAAAAAAGTSPEPATPEPLVSPPIRLGPPEGGTP